MMNGTVSVYNLKMGSTKIIKHDGKEPEKLRDVIGKIPLVIVLPDDTSMIKEGSEERRKFFDGAISVSSIKALPGKCC